MSLPLDVISPGMFILAIDGPEHCGGMLPGVPWMVASTQLPFAVLVHHTGNRTTVDLRQQPWAVAEPQYVRALWGVEADLDAQIAVREAAQALQAAQTDPGG